MEQLSSNYFFLQATIGSEAVPNKGHWYHNILCYPESDTEHMMPQFPMLHPLQERLSLAAMHCATYALGSPIHHNAIAHYVSRGAYYGSLAPKPVGLSPQEI